MRSLKIASWNINSVRIRLDLIKLLTKTSAPDILCLQETKCTDEAFPRAFTEALGYTHTALSGEAGSQKGRNGVALLSRLPLKAVRRDVFGAPAQARHISAVIAAPSGPLTLHNFYVPAGGDVPDPKLNDKFAHKLAFLDDMARFFTQKRHARRMLLLGDLNIAPHENDVWSHRQLLDVVSHTPVEVKKLARLNKTRDWCDIARAHTPQEKKLYSWWSYRARDWRASDRGRRLDHIWTTPALKDAWHDFQIIKEARGWARPSDHAPILVRVHI